MIERKMAIRIGKMDRTVCVGFSRWTANSKVLAKFGKIMEKENEKIPKLFRIGETGFM